MKNKSYKSFMNTFTSKGNKKEESISQDLPILKLEENEEEKAEFNVDFTSILETNDTVDVIAEPSVFESPVVEEKEEVIETTIIGNTMKVTGDIECLGNINIYGEVKGNIITKEDIYTEGKVMGDIQCKNMTSHKSYIEGNLTIDQNIVIEEDTKVQGNLKGNDITVNGQIHGNLEGIHCVSLKEKAIIHGDVSACYISIEKGARINGNLYMKDDR